LWSYSLAQDHWFLIIFNVKRGFPRVSCFLNSSKLGKATEARITIGKQDQITSRDKESKLKIAFFLKKNTPALAKKTTTKITTNQIITRSCKVSRNLIIPDPKFWNALSPQNGISARKPKDTTSLHLNNTKQSTLTQITLTPTIK